MSDYKEYVYKSDEYSHTHEYLLNPVLDLLEGNKKRKILDLGCGNGWLTNYLISQGYEAYGIDASASGIEIAKRKNHNNFFIQDINDENLPEGIRKIPFDTIISLEVIEHIYSPISYLKFCKTVLKHSSKGELILSTPYHGYLKNLSLAVTGKMDKHFTVNWEGGHIKFWSKKTLKSALEFQGFKMKKFIGCGRIPFLWKSMLVIAEIKNADL